MDKQQPLQEITRVEKQGEQASGNACPVPNNTAILWKKMKPTSRLQLYSEVDKTLKNLFPWPYNRNKVNWNTFFFFFKFTMS